MAQSSAEADANNPLASIVALNLQNYYIGELTESDDDANQFLTRPEYRKGYELPVV